jgi:hypothetical protein
MKVNIIKRNRLKKEFRLNEEQINNIEDLLSDDQLSDEEIFNGLVNIIPNANQWKSRTLEKLLKTLNRRGGSGFNPFLIETEIEFENILQMGTLHAGAGETESEVEPQRRHIEPKLQMESARIETLEIMGEEDLPLSLQIRNKRTNIYNLIERKKDQNRIKSAFIEYHQFFCKFMISEKDEALKSIEKEEFQKMAKKLLGLKLIS